MRVAVKNQAGETLEPLELSHRLLNSSNVLEEKSDTGLVSVDATGDFAVGEDNASARKDDCGQYEGGDSEILHD